MPSKSIGKRISDVKIGQKKVLIKFDGEIKPLEILPNTFTEFKLFKGKILSSKDIPYFHAGSYLTITLNINNGIYTRPYSIVSSPLTSYKEKYVEIIVKDNPQGIVSHYINHQLSAGEEVIIEVGLGEFYFNKFRDFNHILAIAGGAGITPFISMAKDIIERRLDLKLTILYGNENPNQMIGIKDLKELEGDNIKVIPVINGKYKFEGEKGLINKDIIKKYITNETTIYFSGPNLMYEYIKKELTSLNIDLRRVRKEAFPISDISIYEGFNKNNIDKVFNIKVHRGLEVFTISCKGNQSILSSLEDNGIKINNSCRGGKCGSCRIKVIEGEYQHLVTSRRLNLLKKLKIIQF